MPAADGTAQAIRAAATRVDPGLAPPHTTLEQQTEDSFARERLA